MIRNLFWLVVIVGLVYAGWTVVDNLLNGVPALSSRKGALGGNVRIDDDRGSGMPATPAPQEPPSVPEDDAGMF